MHLASALATILGLLLLAAPATANHHSTSCSSSLSTLHASIGEQEPNVRQDLMVTWLEDCAPVAYPQGPRAAVGGCEGAGAGSIHGQVLGTLDLPTEPAAGEFSHTLVSEITSNGAVKGMYGTSLVLTGRLASVEVPLTGSVTTICGAKTSEVCLTRWGPCWDIETPIACSSNALGDFRVETPQVTVHVLSLWADLTNPAGCDVEAPSVTVPIEICGVGNHTCTREG